MHPDATKNVTRNCYQTFCPGKTDFGTVNFKAAQKGKFSGNHLLTRLLANFRAPSELLNKARFGNGRLLASFASDFTHTPFLPQNKYPSRRNSLRGFLVRESLPFNPALITVLSSPWAWLRQFSIRAQKLLAIRRRVFPIFSYCSPPHVR